MGARRYYVFYGAGYWAFTHAGWATSSVVTLTFTQEGGHHVSSEAPLSPQN